GGVKHSASRCRPFRTVPALLAPSPLPRAETDRGRDNRLGPHPRHWGIEQVCDFLCRNGFSEPGLLRCFRGTARGRRLLRCLASRYRPLQLPLTGNRKLRPKGTS
uniref:Uncharacterized protein n=1 Tax=Chelonoidis abingdonii TaxID=106734 RepID=A0A8C0IWX1_CHEAB